MVRLLPSRGFNLGGGTTPTPRAPYPTGLPSIAFASGTYTATDAPFGGDGTITVTRRWLLDGVSVGTGATLADSATIQAGKALVLENDASNAVGSATVKPVSLAFLIPKPEASTDPRIKVSAPPIFTIVNGLVAFSDIGTVTTANANSATVDRLYKLIVGTEVVEEADDPSPVFARTFDASDNGKSVVVRLAADMTVDGILYLSEDDSAAVVVDIAPTVGGLPSIVTLPSVTYTSLRVDSTVMRVAPKWDDSVELRFQRAWAYPNDATVAPFLPIQSTDPAATVAGLLPTGWTLLAGETGATLKLPAVLVGKPGAVYLSLKGNANGATLAASALFGPVEAAVTNVPLLDGVVALSSPSLTGSLTGTKKDPITDSAQLPSGVSLSGRALTIGTAGVELSGWNLDGYSLDWNVANVRVVDCDAGEASQAIAGNKCFTLGLLAHQAKIENITFTGRNAYSTLPAFINMLFTSGGPRSSVGAQDVLIEDSRFLKASIDAVKLWADGAVFQRNYSDAPVNYDPATPTWSATTSYGDLAFVLSAEGRLFRSKGAGNLNHRPSTVQVNSSYSDAYWEWLNPHSDFLTLIGGGAGGGYVTRNHIVWPDIYATQITNILRHSRNINTEILMPRVLYEGNYFVEPVGGYYPLEVTQDMEFKTSTAYAAGDLVRFNGRVFQANGATTAGQSPTTHPLLWSFTRDLNYPGPVEFRHNWFAKGLGGQYIRVDLAVGPHVVWDSNYDQVTKAAIAAPAGAVLETTAEPFFGAAKPGYTAPAAYGPAAVFDVTPSAWGSVRYNGAYVSAVVLKVDDMIVGHIPQSGGAVAYANMNVAFADQGSGRWRLTVQDLAGTGTMPGTLRVAAGLATVAVNPATYPARISVGIQGRSNMDYLTLTDKGANYQNAGIQRPTIPASPTVMFYGQNYLNENNQIFSRRIDNVSGSMDPAINTESNTSVLTNRGIMNIAMMTVAEWWCQMSALKGWSTALDLVAVDRFGREQVDLLDNETSDPDKVWLWSDFTGTLALVGREPDLVIQKWNYAATGGSSDKRSYLRLANAAAPASAYTPGSVSSIDRTFWDLNIAAGTKTGPNPPAYSTNSKLAIVPEDTLALRNTLKTMMADADWLKVLRPNFLGRADGFAADGGHAYSDAVSGQVLASMTSLIPHIVSYLYSRGMVDIDPVSPDRVGWTIAADLLSATCYIEMPNGGDLYTPRETWGIAFPVSPRADQQPYGYLFIQRAGEAESAAGPIMRVGSAAFTDPNGGATIPSALNHQGTVSLVSRGAIVPSITLNDGTVVTNGRFAQLRVDFPSGYPLAAGDKLHTGRNHWPWLDNGPDPITQEPALDIPKEFIASLAPSACLRRWVGLDLGKWQTPYTVPSTTPPNPVGLYPFATTTPGYTGNIVNTGPNNGLPLAVTGGWEWTPGSVGAKTLYWPIAPVMDGSGTFVLDFEIELTDVTDAVSLKGGFNTALTTVRGPNRNLMSLGLVTTANSKTTVKLTAMPAHASELDYLGFSFTSTVAAKRIRVTNLVLTAT